MPFKFPLTSVLRYRETVEKKEEIALQKIQFEIARIHGRMEELEALIVQMTDSLELAMRKTLQANLMQAMFVEVQVAREAKQNFSRALEVLHQQRNTQMKAYQAAHSGRQMLTELFLQERDAYELKQARTLQRQIDDIFTARSQGAR